MEARSRSKGTGGNVVSELSGWLRSLPRPVLIGILLVLIVAVVGGSLVLREHQQTGERKDSVDDLIAFSAREQGLDPKLVHAVVQAESNYDPQAVSNLGAKGLMQIMPNTLKDARERFDLPSGDLHDPEYNLRVGTSYLAYLLQRFEGDLAIALAAYHMGPTRTAKRMSENPDDRGKTFVDKHAGPATRAYVAKILSNYQPDTP